MDPETAKQILKDASPDPMGRPNYRMAELNERIDLSVIVPVYNHKTMSDKCIQSLLNQQTKYRFELILVDDGSSDGIQEIVDRYKENNENVIVIHQENTGIAGARNIGIENAHGKYLMFVDCDDLVYEDIIETLMNQAFEKDADIAMCAHELVKVRDGRTVSRLPNIYPQRNLLGYRNHDEIMNYPGLPWCKVYRRELWEKVRYFPGYWYEDNIIHSLIFTQSRGVAYVPEVKYEYYWHETNFSHVQNKKQQVKAIDSYWLLLAILERYEALSLPQDAVFYTMLLKHLSAYYYTMIDGLPEEIVDAMFVVARELLKRYQPVQKVKLPYMLRQTEIAMLRNDIELWKLCSANQ